MPDNHDQLSFDHPGRIEHRLNKLSHVPPRNNEISFPQSSLNINSVINTHFPKIPLFDIPYKLPREMKHIAH